MTKLRYNDTRKIKKRKDVKKLNKKNFKRLIMMGSLLLIFAFTLGGCSSTSDEGLVARVNKEEITEEEFQSEFELFKMAYEKQFGEDVMTQVVESGETFEEKLKNDIMEKLIIEKLLFKEAEDMKITVTEEELQEQVDISIESIGGQEQFEEYLEENGLTKEILEENLRKEMLVTKYGEKFNEETKIPEEDAKEYFEANKEELVVIQASHILVETEEEGKEILKKLEEGEEFASLALIESIDSGSAMDGGNLGYFPKGSLIAEFEDVAFALKPGETSDVVKTEVGYHIIHLVDRKDSYEALETDLKDLLVRNKYMEKVQRLSDSAKIKFFGEFDKKE